MKNDDTKGVCGIVMPISSIDGCNESHWREVENILKEAIKDSGFNGSLVSSSEEVGIIQKNIIQNLYDNPIVVCDVSCKNPNVMFELGLRLAFDKPTIIIKDDKTSYTFDTSVIEHLEYPRDLRFSQIVEFKRLLSEKIKATYEKAASGAGYITFLKHFGEFKIAKIDQKEVSGQEFILDELKSMRQSLNRMGLSTKTFLNGKQSNSDKSSDINLCLAGFEKFDIREMLDVLNVNSRLTNHGIEKLEDGHYHIFADVQGDHPKDVVKNEVRGLIYEQFRTKKGTVNVS